MKSKKNLLEQLKTLPFFDKNTIYQFGRELRLTDSSVDTYISRFLKYREIIKFKKGFYVSADFFHRHKGDSSYLFYLANVLYPPSYISSWAALQYYNLATEVIQVITSVAPKTTRSYQTKAGNFSYQSIKKELFRDFLMEEGKFNFFIATPSKALFDLLYFKTNQFRGIKKKEIDVIIDSLRIDISEMEKEEREKFYLMINKYLNERTII